MLGVVREKIIILTQELFVSLFIFLFFLQKEIGRKLQNKANFAAS